MLGVALAADLLFYASHKPEERLRDLECHDTTAAQLAQSSATPWSGATSECGDGGAYAYYWRHM